MKAVILAAGEGKRMQPLTATQPKVMLTVANQPILEHLLNELKGAGVTDFLFIVGYHSSVVREYFQDGRRWGVNIDYVTQRVQSGTGHAVKTVKGQVNGRFILANGDVIVGSQDIRKLLSHNDPCLSLVEVSDTTDLGVVEIANNQVLRIYEKVFPPPTKLANAGVYLLTSDIFTALDSISKSPRGEYELPDAIQFIIDRHHLIGYEIVESWLNLSFPWDLLDANKRLLSVIEPVNRGKLESNVKISGRVSIGKGTVVRSGVYVTGPVIIGENCDIGPHAYLRANTSIGNGCHIGGSVEIKNSIIMDGTKIPHLSYIGDSIIAQNCNLGAGTMIANLRFDHQDIFVGGINTHRRKFGAVIGAEVQTGINSCVNAGCMIGNGCRIGPGACASGTIKSGTTLL